jgi:hypothetical protein
MSSSNEREAKWQRNLLQAFLSSERVAALLETRARQEPARSLARRGYLAASLEFCGERAQHSQPGFSFNCVRCLEHPLRERNVLLLASGYAPLYSEKSMDAEQMAIVTRAAA